VKDNDQNETKQFAKAIPYTPLRNYYYSLLIYINKTSKSAINFPLCARFMSKCYNTIKVPVHTVRPVLPLYN